MRAIIFYPAVALAALAIILASFGYALSPPKPAPQDGRLQGAVRVFDAAALFHMEPGEGHIFYFTRGPGGAPAGVQMATLRTQREPTPALQGARLLLGPAAAAEFTGKALIAEVKLRPLPFTTAPQLAVSVQAPGPVEWIAQDLPAEDVTLSFRLPAIEGAAPEAIGFWPIATAEDYDYGVEIVELRVRPEP